MEYSDPANINQEIQSPSRFPLSQALSVGALRPQTNSSFEDYNQFTQSFNSELQPRNNEVSAQYRTRKAVYDGVLNDLKDHEKALCYSNIWANKIYLGVKYPKKIEEMVVKYAPEFNK